MHKENVMNEEEKEILANARVGYQAAIQVWINESKQTMDKTKVMLLFNSLLLSGIQLLLSKGDFPFVILFLCPFGFSICIIWKYINKRSKEYNGYWIKSAREIEEIYLANSVKTLSRGASFSSGMAVSILSEGKPYVLQMESSFSVYNSFNLLIIIIAILYPIYALLSIYIIWGSFGLIFILIFIIVILFNYIKYRSVIKKYLLELRNKIK